MNKYKNQMKKLKSYYVKKIEQKFVIEKNIKQLENEINCTLPIDYQIFLLNFGCIAFEDYVSFSFLEPYSGGDRGSLSVFFGVIPGASYDLIVNYHNYQSRMPYNFLPIANDPGGNVVCLSLKGNDKGVVYFWDHNEEEMVHEGEEPGYSNVYLLANCFDDFINSLEIDDEDDEVCSQISRRMG